MIPRTPAGALLWECWRLSRRSLLMLMAASTLIGGALLLGLGASEVAMVFSLAVLMITGLAARIWSDSVDNRNGFTLVLGFARPVRTWVLVLVPIAYIGISSAVTYLVPATALRLVFEVPFPLWPVAVALAALNVMLRASQWWSAHRLVRVAGRLTIALLLAGWFLLTQSDDGVMAPDRWTEISSLSAGGYARMLLVVALAVGLTVIGVGRQRRGDDLPLLGDRAEVRGGTAARRTFAARALGLLRPPCPTSSPLRAQLWFEAQALGIPVMLVGVGGAVSIAVLTALIVASEGDPTMQAGLAGLALWAAIAPLIFAARRVLGLRRKQGSVFLGSFDGTRPLGDARMVAIRVGVATAGLLVAWAVIAVTSWAAFESASPGGELIGEIAGVFAGAFAGMPAWRTAGGLGLLLVQAAGVLACWAALNAALVLRRERVTTAFGLFGAVIVALTYAMYRGWADSGWVAPIFWILGGLAVVVSLAAVAASRAEGVLSSRGAVGILLGWGVVAALQLSLVPRVDLLNPGDVPVAIALGVFLTLPPLAGAALAPLAFGRLRHR